MDGSRRLGTTILVVNQFVKGAANLFAAYGGGKMIQEEYYSNHTAPNANQLTYQFSAQAGNCTPPSDGFSYYEWSAIGGIATNVVCYFVDMAGIYLVAQGSCGKKAAYEGVENH
jgi:hypothetical protein